MKFRPSRLGLARSLVAFAVSFAVILSTHTFAFASLHGSRQSESAPSEFRLTTARATATRAGVVIEWQTNAAASNLGFNIYRMQDGRRTRVNREIIPGAVFISPGAQALMRGGYSYAWFDRAGTADSTYYIESVSLQGTAQTHEAISAVASKTDYHFEQTPNALQSENASATESLSSFEKSYPTAEAGISSGVGTLEEQWAIAGQPGLKIGIKKDGWYRVTKAQMAAAGFNPTVEIRNLRLFVDAQEVAINTSQQTGPFGSNDYIEFYGHGLDTPTTDTQVYYLIAGTSPGKRVRGENQLSDLPSSTPTPTPPSPIPSPSSTPSTPSSSPPLSTPPMPTPTADEPVLRDPIFYSSVQRNLNVWLDSLRSRNATRSEVKENDNTRSGNAQSDSVPAYSSPTDNFRPDIISQPGAAPPFASSPEVNPDNAGPGKPATVAAAKAEANAANTIALQSPARPARARAGQVPRRAGAKKRKRARRREVRSERNHADINPDYSPPNFDNTAERKDRTVYYSSLLNGDAENYFGQVISSNPASQTITVPNPDLTAAGPAQLEVAMQGVNLVYHQVSVKLNGVTLGMVLPPPPQNSFFGQSHVVATFDVPVSLLQNGANTLTFTPTTCTPTCFDTTIVDYARLTYAHQFRADTNSLKFSLRGTQSVKIDGFAMASVRLIDYTDPLAVSISRPQSEPSISGFAITVPTRDPPSKPPRLLYAIPDGQFAQPASLSLNQPSSLNLSSNTADFLIISHKDFIPSFTANVLPANTSFVAQRQSQGLHVSIVDIEDVYDEFSYGKHGPQAIKDFLRHVATHWNNQGAPPRYVIFAGDASIDPHNYQGAGNFDLVPTKLIDATYNETASDDWLADFDGDGIADIPVGRLPFRIGPPGDPAAEASLVISKIVNYAPANVPQTAMLVADDPGTPPVWDFESGSDNVQALLPASMTVDKAYRRLEIKTLTGTLSTNSSSTTVTGTGTLFTTPAEVQVGSAIVKVTGEPLGTVASISSATSLTLTANAPSTYTGAYGKQDDATATAHIVSGFNQGRAIVNYSGHGNVNVWTGASIFTTANALALTNGNKLSFVVVMDCLNGYFQDPSLLSLSEAFLKAPNGGAVAAFASSGLTTTFGQRQMELELYAQLYGGSPIALGDAIKIAKAASGDIDVRTTWIFFGDPSMKIR